MNSASLIDPFHVENRIHGALLKAVEGKPQDSLAQLNHLAHRYPNAHKALLYSGALLMQMGQPGVALQTFERYLKEAPVAEQPPGLSQEVARMRREMRQSP